MTKEEFVRFIMLFICFMVTFWLGYTAGQLDMEEKLQDKEIELNICNASMDLFKEDFDAFCADRFEKMNCGL